MPATFTDGWVVDQVLFQTMTASGGCACCGIAFNPDVAAMMADCSDIDTDARLRERRSRWPPFIHKRIWKDRVIWRRWLKSVVQRVRDGGLPTPDAWSPTIRISEVHALLTRLKFSPPTQMMILALITQLAKYECTIYSADGQSPMESAFEPGLSADDESMCVSDASVAMELLNECAESSHLIERKARPAHDESVEPKDQTFAPDRRLLRLTAAAMMVGMGGV